MEPSASAKSINYLRESSAPADNFHQFLGGALDIAPFEADTTDRDQFQRQAKRRAWGGVSVLVLGLGVGALAKGRYRFAGLVSVPVGIGCYFWRGKALDQVTEANQKMAVLKKDYDVLRPQTLRNLYSKMKDYLVQTRQDVERKILSDFNEKQISNSEDGKFPPEAQLALRFSWDIWGQPYTNLKHRLNERLMRLQGVDIGDIPLEKLRDLNNEWQAVPQRDPDVGFGDPRYHAVRFSEGTCFYIRPQTSFWVGRPPNGWGPSPS